MVPVEEAVEPGVIGELVGRFVAEGDGGSGLDGGEGAEVFFVIGASGVIAEGGGVGLAVGFDIRSGAAEEQSGVDGVAGAVISEGGGVGGRSADGAIGEVAEVEIGRGDGDHEVLDFAIGRGIVGVDGEGGEPEACSGIGGGDCGGGDVEGYGDGDSDGAGGNGDDIGLEASDEGAVAIPVDEGVEVGGSGFLVGDFHLEGHGSSGLDGGGWGDSVLVIRAAAEIVAICGGGGEAVAVVIDEGAEEDLGIDEVPGAAVGDFCFVGNGSTGGAGVGEVSEVGGAGGVLGEGHERDEKGGDESGIFEIPRDDHGDLTDRTRVSIVKDGGSLMFKRPK